MQTILIDAYNLIHQIDSLYELFISDMQKARSTLIFNIENVFLNKDIKVVIVFDSKEGGIDYYKAKDNVSVIFSHPPDTADMLIINYVQKSDKPKSITVVSNDKKDIGANIKEYGSKLISCEYFWKTFIIHKKQANKNIPQEKPEIHSEEDIKYWEEYFFSK